MQTAFFGALPANDAQHLRAYVVHLEHICLLPVTQLTFQTPFRHPLDTRSSTAEH